MCADGAQTACEYAGSARDCYNCGCESDQVCDGLWRTLDEGPGQCLPRRAIGEGCLANTDCASGNCGVDATNDRDHPGTCYVAGGAACTDQNCGSCAMETCDPNSPPPGCDCYKRATDPIGVCSRSCTPGLGNCDAGLYCVLDISSRFGCVPF
ncbi:MAG: hypothetical protein K8W52_46785 [Deltaproteobacteria bacterium]|nr:hypothetical protein [Deltaproteobacteria bacterium]